MKLHVCLILASIIAVAPRSQAQQAPPYPAPDERYKVDILEVNGILMTTSNSPPT